MSTKRAMPGIMKSTATEYSEGLLLAHALADSREARAKPRPLSFVILVGQLSLLLFVFTFYRLEEPAFFLLSCTAFSGFLVHYWLPFRFKEWFWILLSMGGAYLLLEPVVATLLIGVGLAFFSIVASPLACRLRVAIAVAVFGVLIYGRATRDFNIPVQFWPLFGAVFMFRIIVYLYDLGHLRGRPSFKDYLSYFFLLPNYYFLLFPVIDFQTLRRSYFQRDIHEVAQQGIHWIVRGTIQLLLYRLVYHLKGRISPDQVTTFGAVVTFMILTYLLYLRVSGHFHIIVGILHLFGYDLPETQRRYLLAHSLTDFWRRINIYWKDFMVKIVFFPVYFKLRKGGEIRAQVVATTAVFFATWLLHSYQFFWLRGTFLLTWPDALFWGFLGLLVIGNLLFELRHKRQVPKPGWDTRLHHGLQVVGTFALITILWSLWNSPTLGEWSDLLTWWKIG